MRPKRAINYARVSTPRQAELYSLDYQLEQERAYDEDMGFVIVAEFKDDQSGRKMARDGLQEARDMLARDEADVLITWKLDRLHRSYINTVLLRDEIQRLGKELHYAQMRMKSGTTAKQRLPEDILALMAEIEADEIAERTQMGKREKVVKSGKWIGLGRPPFGYKAVGKGRDVHLEIDEPTASVVRNIFTWYVMGEGATSALSTTEIVNKLTELRVPTPVDLLPHHAHQKQRDFGHWSKSTVCRILRHTAYSGVFYHYRYKYYGDKRRITNRDAWQGVPVPQIVDTSLFEAAQEKLDNGREIASRGVKHEYLVGRRIWCECGYKMLSTSVKCKHTLADGSPKAYVYGIYRCSGREKQAVKNCTMPVKSVSMIDKRVWSWVKEEIANPTVLERKLREIQEAQRGESGVKDQTLQTLYSHKETIEREMKRLATLYIKDELPTRLLDELLAEQSHRLHLTEAEIANSQREMETPLTDETIQNLVTFSNDFRKRLESVERTFEGRRSVIDGLDVKVVVLRQNGEIWLKLSSLLRPTGILLPVSTSS